MVTIWERENGLVDDQGFHGVSGHEMAVEAGE